MTVLSTTDTPLTTRTPTASAPSAFARWMRRGAGVLFLGGALINLSLVAFNPDVYEAFADEAFWPFVTDTWRTVVVPNTTALILLLALFETLVGMTVLFGRRRWRFGLVAAIAFHVALMFFGFGFWMWSIPMLALLACAWRDTTPGSTWVRTPR
jgi:hypothetical protein